MSSPSCEGIWEHSGAVFRDLVKSLIVESQLRAADYDWLSAYKRRLEQRFDQVEVYISVADIKRIV